MMNFLVHYIDYVIPFNKEVGFGFGCCFVVKLEIVGSAYSTCSDREKNACMANTWRKSFSKVLKVDFIDQS